MSFWTYGLSADSSLDALLKKWEPSSSRSPVISVVGQGSRDGVQTPTPTLEQLLEEDDLLQEAKAGNSKLIEYLSSKYGIKRMLAYTSGEAFSNALKVTSEGKGTSLDNDGIGYEPERSKPSNGTAEDKETTKKRLKYPYLCVEILAYDHWQITEAIFGDTATYLLPFWTDILDKPPRFFLENPLTLGHWAKVNMGFLSANKAPAMVDFLKTSIPDLFSKMIAILPFSSSIGDLIVKFVGMDDAFPQLGVIQWLSSEKLIPQTLTLLDPTQEVTTDCEEIDIENYHVAAGDCLKSIVGAASTASAAKQQQQQQLLASSANANKVVEIPPSSLGLGNRNEKDIWASWPDNSLVRELASQETIEKLLQYMLDAPSTEESVSAGFLTPLPKSRQGSLTDSATDESPPTPRAEASQLGLHTPLAPESSLPNPSLVEIVGEGLPTASAHSIAAEAATSSLLNSLTVIIDLIRKNNSDFTELQILQYLERLQELAGDASDDDYADLHVEDSEDDAYAEGSTERGLSSRNQHRRKSSPGIDQNELLDEGPSLVDLTPLLTNITRRLKDIHRLLKEPRSSTKPIKTTLHPSAKLESSAQEPLTFERFRICELYAELLHCSNMGLLNRLSSPATEPPQYDPATGRILGTRKEALTKLRAALQSHSEQNEDAEDYAELHLAGGDRSREITEDEEVSDAIAALRQGAGMSSDEERPVTAQSDVTSSYASSGHSDGDGNAKDDSEDVLEFLNAVTEDLTLDDDGSGSTPNSPLPPDIPRMASLTASDILMNESPTPTSTSPAKNLKIMIDPARSAELGRTASANSVNTREAVMEPVLPGAALKKAFVDLHIVPAVLDLFFRFPWNNSLHNVVYDLVQQIFNGKMDQRPNLDLCIAVFTQGKGLVPSILAAVAENNACISKPGGVRLGYMGHITLISEEIVKLFYNFPNEIIPCLPDDKLNKAEWSAYVENTLKETRERDLQPLGGGLSMAMAASASTGSNHIGLAQADDEFPTQQARPYFSAADGDGLDGGQDKFSRYLTSQISSDLGGPMHRNGLNNSTSSSSSSGSSSSDDVAEHLGAAPASLSLANAASKWFTSSSGHEGDSAFDDYDDEDEDGASGSRHHAGYDFSAGTAIPGPKPQVPRQDKFGFDDAFDPSRFGTGDSDDEEEDDPRRTGIFDDEDEDSSPFSDSYASRTSKAAASTSLGFDDDFGDFSSAPPAKPKISTGVAPQRNLTPADWNKAFRAGADVDTVVAMQASSGEFGDFEDGVNGSSSFDDNDDFGDFKAASNADGDEEARQGDYDFAEVEASPPIKVKQMPPVKSEPRHQTKSAPPPIPALPATTKKRAPPPPPPPRKPAPARRASMSMPGDQVVGPGVHQGAHIAKDGLHVEAEIEVNGQKKTVFVPKDELTLHPELIE